MAAQKRGQNADIGYVGGMLELSFVDAAREVARPAGRLAR